MPATASFWLLCCLLVLSLSGCTIAVPVDSVSGNLQSQIRAGQPLKAGDRVEVTTVDNKQRSLRVKEITDEFVHGYLTSIRIDDIAALSKREFSASRTAVLIGGVVIGLYVVGKAAENSAL